MPSDLSGCMKPNMIFYERRHEIIAMIEPLLQDRKKHRRKNNEKQKIDNKKREKIIEKNKTGESIMKKRKEYEINCVIDMKREKIDR